MRGIAIGLCAAYALVSQAQASASEGGALRALPLELPGATVSFAPIGPPKKSSLADRPGRGAPFAEPPDERPIWRLFHARRFEDLERAIARTKAKHPGWQPPRELLGLMRRERAQAEVRAVMIGKRPDRLVALYLRHPHLFDAIDHRWAVAEAYAALHQSANAYRVLKGAYDRATRPSDRRATLQKATKCLEAAHLDRLLTEAQRAHGRGDPEVEQRYLDHFFGRALPFLSAGDYPRASRMASGLADLVVRRRDTGKAIALGWMHRNLKQRGEGMAWFERAHSWDPSHPDARYGLALAYFEVGRWDEAERLAKADAGKAPRSRGLMGDILLARANQAYGRGEYQACLDLSQAAEPLTPRTRATDLQRAWCHFQLGAYPGARRAFLALHEAGADAESARGVFFSHLKSNRLQELEGRLSDPLLAELLREHRAEALFNEKRLHEAHALMPERFPALAGIDAPWLTSGGSYSERSGADGLSRLRHLRTPLIQGATRVGRGVEIQARLDRVLLDSGELPAFSTLGSPPTTPAIYAASPVTTVTGLAPRVSLASTGELSCFADLGLSPTGGAVPSRPRLALGMKAKGAWGPIQFKGYSSPVQDSLLSFVGTRDPYQGKPWGRVARTGLGLEQALGLGQGQSLGIQAQADRLDGEGVAANDHLGAGIQLQRSLSGFPVEHLGWGLAASYDHYRLNLSQFTLGHGGYFSPQHHVSMKVTCDLLSKELQPFMVSGHLGMGPSFEAYDAAPYFPLAPDGRTYAPSARVGLNLDAELKVVGRINDTIQVGAVAAANRNQYFDQHSFMLTIRYFFQPRAAVSAEDLPTL